jgi:hypothetical protein
MRMTPLLYHLVEQGRELCLPIFLLHPFRDPTALQKLPADHMQSQGPRSGLHMWARLICKHLHMLGMTMNKHMPLSLQLPNLALYLWL